MKAQLTCLNSLELKSFVQGHFPADRLAAVEEHVSSCESCWKGMQELAGGLDWWSDVEIALRSDSAAGTVLNPNESASRLDVENADEAISRRGIIELLGPTDDPHMLGRIGAYEIVGLIGQGGMGAVFKAFDAGLNRFVAIKILLPHLASSGGARERFRREGQAAAAVVNDHVLPIYVVDQWQGTPYLVMQYIRGSTLQQRLAAEGPFQVRDVLRIGLHVARGLEAAHAQGLVHRDVKPSNILLDGGVGRALISDFGLARAADDASLTRSGMLAGTPQFMSPEQIRGERLDPRSDLFSFGSVLYAMCTGHPPFRAESSYGVMRRITDDTPRRIREINPNIPDWLEQLVTILMARRVDDRPQSAAAVANLLQQCLAHTEQPHSVSLPSELQNPQVTSFRRRIRRIIMLVSASAIAAALAWAGLGLLMDEPALNRDGQQATQTNPPSPSGVQAASNQESPADMRGSTTVAGYKITLEGVGKLGDISERVVRFRPKLNMQSSTQGASNFSSDQFSTGQTFNNGNGTGGAVGGSGSIVAGGGGGGTASGGGAGYGHTFTMPTFGIALKITEEGTRGKRDKKRLAQLGTAVKIVELDGTVEEAKDSGPITATWPLFDRQFPGTSGLYVPRRNGLNVPIKEIHGELKISAGRRLEAVFAGARTQKKKAEGEEFAIKSVDQTPEGLTVVVSFPPTNAMKKAGNILERIQLMMSSMNNYELEIEDKSGKVYLPSGASAAGNGGGSTQGFSFNGTTQRRSSQSSEPELSVMAFRFQPIESNSIRTITARIVEVEGEPEVIPFTIQVQAE
jgi:serine/threonine protein kinase